MRARNSRGPTVYPDKDADDMSKAVLQQESGDIAPSVTGVPHPTAAGAVIAPADPAPTVPPSTTPAEPPPVAAPATASEETSADDVPKRRSAEKAASEPEPQPELEPEPERRLDADGTAYTKNEFISYYGDTVAWDAAARPAPSTAAATEGMSMPRRLPPLK